MASAVARMRLYQSEYGLTELRLYTTAFMFWLGLVFIWFAWTVVVRSRRERFACGALVAAFVTIGLLHLLNPDAFIVRANTAHARAGRAFDAEYAASLSADAVPALISALPALSRDERCHVARELTYLWSHPAPGGDDWRAWNFARSRAGRAVAAHRERLSEATCPPPLPQSNVPVITPANAPSPPTPLVVLPPPTTATPSAAATTNTAIIATTNVKTMSLKTAPKGATANAPKRAKQGRGDNRKATRRKQPRAGQRAKAR